MCVGCYDRLNMRLIPGELDGLPTRMTGINLSRLVQPQLSVPKLRAELAAIMQRVPDSRRGKCIQGNCAAMHQRLAEVDDIDHANGIVSAGMLAIVDHLSPASETEKMLGLLY